MLCETSQEAAVNTRRFRFALAVLALLVPAAAAGATTSSGGTWTRLPRAPIAPNNGQTAVWTGKELLVFGVATRRARDGAVLSSRNVAAAYDPSSRTWRRLPDGGRAGTFPPYRSVWTGKEMLVLGQGTRMALNPTTNRWRRLPGSPLLSVHEGHGLVVWTGRELIGWGGGCCGDAFSDGVGFNPATNRWRALAPTPLAGSQHPIGAWTGRELIVLVGDRNPDGRPWPARLGRAAAYNPRTDTWRRIAPLPAPRTGADAVWTGRELLVVGGTSRVGFAYDPATNRWRRLPATDSPRIGTAAVWTGKQLLLWGGSKRGGSLVPPRNGLAYDPRTNRWSPLPRAPLRGRLDPTAVWTGRSLLVWGGTQPVEIRDGASYTPGP
jgi:hypothetical protein